MSVDLFKKSVNLLKVSLEKAGINLEKIEKIAVAEIMDVSGSFVRAHTDGRTSKLNQRLIPYGLTFDDDGKIDFFTFSDGHSNVSYVGELDADNYENFISQKVINKVPGWNGCTDYSYVLQKVLEHYGWIIDKTLPENPCLMVVAPNPRKALIFFTTDGANDDRKQASELLQEMQNKGYKVYIQFFAIGDDEDEFSFLQEVADKYSNTGLYIIKDLGKFVNLSDEEISKIIFQHELIDWLK